MNAIQRYQQSRLNLSELRARQSALAKRIIGNDEIPATIQLIAGADVAFPDNGETTRAAIVLLEYPSLRVVAQTVHQQPTEFPYIPGFLSFREVPSLLIALQQLQRLPDVIFCDGQGIAHPRGFGLACHMGVETGLPCIGVAKSRLIGKHQIPADDRGSITPLTHHGQHIGNVVRSRDRVKPLFVSIGHKISLNTATRLVLECGRGLRLPEPTRLADKLAGAYRHSQ